MEKQPGNPLYRPGDAAKYLGVSRTTLWRMKTQRLLPPPIQVSQGIVGWRQSTLDGWINRREAEGPVHIEKEEGASRGDAAP